MCTVNSGGKGKYAIRGCSVVCVLLTKEQAALPKVKFGVFFIGVCVPASLWDSPSFISASSLL